MVNEPTHIPATHADDAEWVPTREAWKRKVIGTTATGSKTHVVTIEWNDERQVWASFGNVTCSARVDGVRDGDPSTATCGRCQKIEA